MKYNVIIDNINAKKFEEYDIFPYLVKCYHKLKKKPITFSEFKEFILRESHYRWWRRCEYEIILTDWPCKKYEEKWDIYRQIKMNIDVITKLFMDYAI
ncbi:MAG: hypothetical protein ACI4OP_02915 [Candidatus Coprovivens sp.]